MMDRLLLTEEIQEKLEKIVIENTYWIQNRQEEEVLSEGCVEIDFDYRPRAFAVAFLDNNGESYYREFAKTDGSLTGVKELFKDFHINSEISDKSNENHLLITETDFICGYQMIISFDSKRQSYTLIKLGTEDNWNKVFENADDLFVEVFDFLSMYDTKY